MKPVLSAEGLPLNWINYHSGVKHIFFRMEAGRNQASVFIELTHVSAAARISCWQQFQSLKEIFLHTAGTDWTWEQDVVNDAGKMVSRISAVSAGISIYNQEQWPELISFLKPHIMALDRFWTEVKPVFEMS